MKIQSKPIAVAFADLHLHLWKQHNENNRRLEIGCLVLKKLDKVALKYNVPLLFSGDWFHVPKDINNGVLKKSLKTLKSLKSRINAISGNHDMCERNTPENKSPSYIESLSISHKGFINIDNREIGENQFYLYGIPYLTANMGFKDKVKEFSKLARERKDHPNILLIHTDLPGAKNAFNHEIGEVQNIPIDMDGFFKDFTWVLAGHIHKPQRLGKRIFMLGSPCHQTMGDMGVKMGYWLIYADKAPQFVDLEMPEFKYYESNEKPDDYHFWVPKPKEILVDKDGKDKFDNKMDKIKIVKNYLKVKNITDKDKREILVKVIKST